MSDNYNTPKDIEIDNATIKFINFSGREMQKNPKGKRNFVVEIPDDDWAEELKSQGWNVNMGKIKDEETGEHWPASLKVNVSYVFPQYAPDIYMVTSKRKMLLNENTVGRLDKADIQNVDLVITPSKKVYENKNGDEIHAAFVKVMYVTIAEPRFAEKYADLPEDDIDEEE